MPPGLPRSAFGGCRAGFLRNLSASDHSRLSNFPEVGGLPMAHRRKPLARALALNTAVLVAEIAGGITANSLSLVMDGVHNVSDEAGLALLLVAYWMRAGLSGRFIRLANLFNSIGLIAVCGFLV